MPEDPSRTGSNVPVFRFLDRKADIEITSRKLPHWFQVGAAMFVTFRTADSMPREVVLRFQEELKDWLKRNHLPLELADRNVATVVPNCHPQENQLRTIDATLLAQYKKLRARAWHHSLDECHGECLLKRPKLSRIVADALLYYHGSKYDLDRFVIMPNHVHAIVQFRPGATLATISQSWMRFSARQINAETGRSGGFWQPEAFDHIIRNENQFD